MDVSSHTVLFPAGEQVPSWVHLVPAGTFRGQDGRGPYHLRDAAAVIAASMQQGKLPIDESHATVLAATTGAPAPARGWIVELQSRDNGIWGRVEWTQTGTALMQDGAYKGISPVFDHAKDGTVLRIRNAALTNNPNLLQLTAMHGDLSAAWRAVDAQHATEPDRAEARRRIRAQALLLGVDTSGWEDNAHAAHFEGHMDKKAICTALGLPETVDDAGVLTAVQTAHQAAATLHAAQAEAQRLKAELEVLRRTTVPVETATAMQSRLDSLEAEGKRGRAEMFVDGAIKAGKPIRPMREVYIAQHIADAAGTEKVVNALPSINAAYAGAPQAALQGAGAGDGMDDMMTAEDAAVCAKMGTDPKALAQYRKKMAAQGNGGKG